jgi:hypothetical protein
VLSVLLPRNEPGSRGGSSASQYHDAPQGATRTAHGGITYSPAPVWYLPQPGMPMGYEMSQVRQRPHVGQSPRSEYHSVPSANEPHTPHNSFKLQWSQGPATAAQGPSSEQNALGVPYSQVGRQSSTEGNRTGPSRTMVASPPGRQLSMDTAFSYLLPCILNPSFTIVEWPAAPQEFNLSGQRNLPPQMPVPLPFFCNTGRRRALVVSDRQTENHTLILIGI